MRSLIPFGGLMVWWSLSACGSGPTVEKETRPTPAWTGLAINWNRYDVYLESDKDTLFWFDDTRRVYVMEGEEDSTSGSLYKAQLPISAAEKDSILRLATEVVLDAVKEDDWLTCYAGDNVRIKLTSGATAISLSYASVPDWLSLSPKHARLKALTFDRFDSVPRTLVESR